MFLVRRGVTNKNLKSVGYLILAFGVLMFAQYISSFSARFSAEGRLCSNEQESGSGFFRSLLLIFTEVYELIFSIFKWFWHLFFSRDIEGQGPANLFPQDGKATFLYWYVMSPLIILSVMLNCTIIFVMFLCCCRR